MGLQFVRLAASFGCSSVRGRTSEPMAERFCHVAELLAEYLPLCYSNRESRQRASIHKLQICRRSLSMSEKRGKT